MKFSSLIEARCGDYTWHPIVVFVVVVVIVILTSLLFTSEAFKNRNKVWKSVSELQQGEETVINRQYDVRAQKVDGGVLYFSKDVDSMFFVKDE